eukprot:CAMPEP_0178904766 /NCGR_PEP_ID=MMETSP0786-20121207/5880_1 /TAXON_ID=186022 /ORGANISM="Thalassionema frauenfeldii, Strain CCMP 1798" /LENGTH=71 /DNA_ID=CAMNT_0020576255 /DNA_START=461 /DNA_END=676 /DNA_ORIENTATION=+
MTIELPKHRQERLMEILHSIAPSQKQVSLQKWHQVLGKLRSMAIALPDIRGLACSAFCKKLSAMKCTAACI